MIRTVEAVIDEHGAVLLQEAVTLSAPRSRETSLLSEAALAEDWDRPEEDAAWSHLQPVLSSVRG